MKETMVPLFAVVLCAVASQVCLAQEGRPFAEWAPSDTWAATDALGRALPTAKEAGPRREGKYVAIFYWTWHVDGNVAIEPVNIQMTTQRYPEAVNDFEHPVWGRVGTRPYWDEPLFGFYRATDPWVLRKHAEMLADAGVDAIIFDATNGSLTWKNSYEVLFPVLEKARADGVRTPKFAFMLPFGPSGDSLVSVKQLYKDVYEPGLFKDLWFMWKGKPLIMAYPDNVPEPIKSFFTFRPGQPVYRTGPTRPDHWGWLEIYPQHGFCKTDGKFEQVTVGVAQNATDKLWPAAMNDTEEVYGRGYTVKAGPNHSPDAVAQGLNFQEQWSRAFELDPELIFITGWNEWIMGRYKVWQQTKNAFPDQFNDEYSRDTEPMRGGFGDNYYCQLVANVRRFKGVSAPIPVSAETTIRVDGKFDEWAGVRPEYKDHISDTMPRNHPGCGQQRVYTNASGRNDVILSKVASDPQKVCFYAKTAAELTKPEGPHWMMLLIDWDRNKATGWQGYEFVINRQAPGEQAILEWSANEWKWTECGRLEWAASGNEIELSVPLDYLGNADAKLNFEFKWVDNMVHPGDIMDFYQYGDAAPGGRFNYVFEE